MKLFVAGSINQDILIEVDRQPAIGETTTSKNLSYAPGGKGANQAVAASRAGADTIFLGAVGDDVFGNALVAGLAKEGISVEKVKVCESNGALKSEAISVGERISTGIAIVTVVSVTLDNALEREGTTVSGDSDAKDVDNLIVVHPGANGKFLPTDIIDLEIEKGLIEKEDFVLAQFETPVETTLELFKQAKKVGATTVLNPAPAAELDTELLAVVDYLIVNEIELEMISKIQKPSIQKLGEPRGKSKKHEAKTTTGETHSLKDESSQKDDISPEKITPQKNMLSQLQNEFGLSGIICTLGKDGAIGCNGDNIFETSAASVEKVVDTTGAGDCFVGVFSAMLMSGKDFEQSMYYANKAAGLAVQALGAQTALPYKEDILNSK